MSGFPAAEFVTGVLLSGAAVVILMLVTWAIGVAIGRFNGVDVAWGLGFALVALISFLWSAGDGDDSRRVVVLVLVTAWGVRLAAHIAWRSRGQGEDPRYAKIFAHAERTPAVHALTVIYPTQAVILLFVSLPAQVAMYERAAPNALLWLGAVVWGVGFFFETVGDWQLHAFRADPTNTGAVMDRGLWRYTRHPNYFGDACVWWGVWLVAAQQLPGLLTVLSPVAMTFLLARGTGKPMLERDMSTRRPGYPDYVRRTSGFFPWPPKKNLQNPTG